MIKLRKKQFGQFFTPPRIAGIAVKLISKKDDEHIVAADPGFGEGALSYALISRFSNARIDAYEIDELLVKQNFLEKNIQLINQDYFLEFNKNKYDVIICNPPYNRFQNYENINQISIIEQNLNIEVSKLSSSYVIFIYKAIHELKDEGEAIFIVPIEFFNTKYGIDLKSILYHDRMLHSVVLFNTDWSHFADAITTTCIIKITKRPNKTISIYRDFNNEIEMIKQLDYSEIQPEKKWSHVFSSDGEQHFSNQAPLYKYAKVSRGIATGANNYFILSPSQVSDLKLNHNSVRKCVVKSVDIVNPILDIDCFNDLELKGKSCYIFTGQESNDQATIKYIKMGVELGIDKTFLNSRRKPWYKLEKDVAYPILLSVFDRSNIKVVYNKVGVLNLTTFHGLSVNSMYSKYIKIIFLFLLTKSSNSMFKKSKRIYGNGLNKLEPNDYNETNVLDFEILDLQDLSKLNELFSKLEKDNLYSSDIINEAESVFLNYLT